MVCVSEPVAKIAGGFVPVPVASLMAAWRASRDRPLGPGDFRAWLACHEMKARRGLTEEGRAPAYRSAELAGLCGVTERRARGSVRRLVAAGLLGWSDSAIGFPDRGLADPDLEDSLGGGAGRVMIPRRMLRFLARGARPALIATTLGVLLRCLSRRRDGFDGRGRVKASWVARAFHLSIPAVKTARRELVDLGWVAPEDGDQWAMNRWGRAFRIDLAWAAPRPGPCAQPIPPPPRSGAQPIPPDLQTPIPSRRNEHQEPASGGRTGACMHETGETQTESIPAGREPVSGPPAPTPAPRMPSAPAPAPTPAPAPAPTPAPIPAPTLADVRPEDLRDTGRTLELYRQAVAQGLVKDSEASRLAFVASAVHSSATGANPAALMAATIRRGWWDRATQADEDTARRKLRDHLAEVNRPVAAVKPAPAPAWRSTVVLDQPEAGPKSLGTLLAAFRIGSS